jgi:hypothetical protein
MFLRSSTRKKNGKRHTYWSIVRTVVLTRYTQPEEELRLLLARLKLELPSQPPPRIVAQKNGL